MIPESAPSPPPARRAAARVLRFAIAALALAAAIPLCGIVLLQFPAPVRWAAQVVLDRTRPIRGTRIVVGGARGGFLTGLELHDLELVSGSFVHARVDTLRGQYRIEELIGRPLRIREVDLSGLEFVTTPALDSLRVWFAPRASSGKPPFPLDIDRIEVERGALWVARGDLAAARSPQGRPWHFQDLALRLSSLHARGAETTMSFDSLGATLFAPDSAAPLGALAARARYTGGRFDALHLTLESRSSHVALDGAIAVSEARQREVGARRIEVRLAPLAGVDLVRLFPRLPRAPDLDLEAQLASARDSLAFGLTAHSSDGARLSASGHVDHPDSGASVQLRAQLSGLDPGAWGRAKPQPLRVSGTAQGRLGGPDLAHLSGPLALEAQGIARGEPTPRARASVSAMFGSGAATVRARGSLGAWALRAAGTVRPLGRVTGCDLDLEAEVPPYDPWHAAGRPHPRALIAGRLTGSLKAERVAGAPATARAELDFDPESPARSELGPGRLALSLERGALLWNARVQIERGTLNAQGNFVSGPEPRYAVRSGEAHALPIGEWLGDSTASALDASFALEGRGLDPASAHIDARFAPVTLELRRQSVRLDSLLISLQTNRWSARWAGAVDGAAIAGRADAAPATPPYREAGTHVEFSGVDAARIASDTSWASTLGGSVDVAVSAPDLGRWLTPTRMSESQARAANGTLRVVLVPSTWRHEQLSQMTLDATLADGGLSTDGRLEGGFGRLQWSASARPFGEAPDAHLTSLTLGDVDLARLIAPSLPHTRLSGELNAQSSGAKLDTLTAHSGVNLDGSSVAGARFSRLRLSGGLARGVMEARLEADRGPDSLLARIAGRLTHARRGLGFSGQLRGAVQFGGASFDTMLCDFALAQDELEVPRLHLAGNVADVLAHGRLALSRGAPAESTELSLAAALRDVRPLGERLRLKPCEAGAGFLIATARGPVEAREISAALRATRIRAGTSRADSLDLTARALIRGSTIDSASAHGYLRGLVLMSLPERDLDARARWSAGELTLGALALVNDGGRQELALRLKPGDPITNLWLDRLVLRTRGSEFALVQPADIELGHGLSVDHLELMQDGRRCIHVDGAVRDDSSAALIAALDSVDVAVPLALLGVAGLDGRVSASMTLTGPRRDPTASGWLRGVIGVGGGRPARLNGAMSWREGSLAGELHFDQTAQQLIAARVTLPIALNLDPRSGERMLTVREDTLEAALEAKRFDVGWFQPLISPRVARKLDGSIDGSVGVSGSPREPRFDGALALSHAKVQVPPLGTTFETRSATLAFRSRTIELQPAVVTSGGGRLELSGAATVDGPGHRSLDAHAQFIKFQLMNTALAHVEVNGNLAVAGPLGRPALTGALELANSTLYLEGGQSDRRLEPVELSEDDWRELDARFSESDAAVKRPFAALTDSSSVDVTVKMGRNVWVRRRSDPIVALELSGQVRAIRQPGAAPELAGQLNVETGRSYLSFLNRRFDMTRARVDLPGPLAQAHAELEAQYLPGASGSNSSAGPDVTAVVTLGAGGARVDLHSTPFMDHAALVNYLATGQTQGEMSSGTAYGLAVGSVLGSVGGSAGRSLGLDVVQVTQDAYGGQTLAAGSHVKPELYLGFRQPVVQGQQNSSRGENSTYTTEFEVELEAGRQMLLNLQGGGSQYRFLIRPRLGK